MTVPEAAIKAAAQSMADDWNPDRDPVLTAMFSDYSATALAAATPHLRAAWAAELGETFQSGERWNETYRKGLRTLQYEKAYLDGVIDILALLEGGGE